MARRDSAGGCRDASRLSRWGDFGTPGGFLAGCGVSGTLGLPGAPLAPLGGATSRRPSPALPLVCGIPRSASSPEPAAAFPWYRGRRVPCDPLPVKKIKLIIIIKKRHRSPIPLHFTPGQIPFRAAGFGRAAPGFQRAPSSPFNTRLVFHPPPALSAPSPAAPVLWHGGITTPTAWKITPSRLCSRIGDTASGLFCEAAKAVSKQFCGVAGGQGVSQALLQRRVWQMPARRTPPAPLTERCSRGRAPVPLHWVLWGRFPKWGMQKKGKPPNSAAGVALVWVWGCAERCGCCGSSRVQGWALLRGGDFAAGCVGDEKPAW